MCLDNFVLDQMLLDVSVLDEMLLSPVDPPDRRQVWKALNFKCHLFLKEVGKN